MGRTAKLLVGVALLLLGVAMAVTSVVYASVFRDGGYYITSLAPFAAGIILVLRALDGAKADPAADVSWKVPGDAPVAAPEGPAWATQDVDQPFTTGEAIGVALRVLRQRPWATVATQALGQLAALAVGAAIGGISWALERHASGPVANPLADPSAHPVTLSPALPLLPFVGAALGLLVVFPVTMAALIETALASVRRQRVAPGVMARAVRRAPAVLVLELLVMVTALVPTGLLAIPFVFAPFFVVDQGSSIGAAVRKSWRSSKPYVGTLWIFHIALAPISLLGYVTWVLSAVTIPLYVLGLAYGYVRATGRNDLPWVRPEFASASIRNYLQVTFLALAALFGGLVLWVENLPKLRGSAWSIKDTAIRASTILTGVAAIIVLLALLLPYILDRLEGRRFTSFVAARHVRSQKSGFLTVISILSIMGVAMSSCSLSAVVSVMGGFSQDLKRKILGNNAHIVIDTTPGTPFDGYEDTLAKVRAIKGVTGATPVVHGEVMASSASNLAGVIVTGIDPKTIQTVIDLGHNIDVGKLEYLEHPEMLTHLPPNEVIGIGPGGEQYFKGAELPSLADDIDPAVKAVIVNKSDRPGIILGRELAKTLHVYVGDEITLVSPLGDLGPMGVMPRTRRFRVAAIFYSGMYEYDATYVYTMIDQAQDYFQTGDEVSAIEVKVEDAEHADVYTPEVVQAIARPELRVRDWHEINKNLFSALKLERFATFVILSIAILVASFCIVCTLLLMVTEKGKEIAILKAIGASDGAILRTFMIEGIIIGAIGTVFGVVTGLGLCTGLSWFGLRLDPEVYYIDRLPISVNGWDFLTVAAAALTICTLSTLYPAFAASRLRPVDGLRYE
jgi:lipoprotein-releasing system permease protein